MSNKDPEKFYDNLPDLLEFAFSQMLKGIYTALPGVVISYNQGTKRAQVQPALDVLLTDGETAEQPTVANVPVIHPSGGGFTLLTPVRAGDTVLMLFTQRGLSKFKQVFSRTEPDREGFFSLKDAVVLPGFGALQVSPATASGASMQSEDGANAVYVENGHIRITTSGTVRIEGNTTIDGTLTVTGAASLGGGGTVTGDLTVSGTVTADDYIET